ncbi:tachylectin-related carbohydrate-binding protein [Streptomyces europaeiscabiei]|uniref:tachylectin-related carbohydrate-binding protein n=1 Tax=Streptomyces europaeiscabiei TaxID=146819 RepID=UPI0029ACEB67|nr:tachylectin-related carbohydrate-binding protein [Streptomyces europaeiscabiei]MDX2524734.1 tachylectin-related carbohydrate-binding protein [Streptomyces europaeiscabiei]MDX3783539.1 tachylectin-related carbohydrate-binding protein [Streptomyces europaeiscabiei]
MSGESELFETVVDEVPYLNYVAKGVKAILLMYEFGRQSDEERAIEKLHEQVAAIKADLTDLNERVNVLNSRVVQSENLARIRRIDDFYREAEALTFQLTRTPDADELAIIAKKAYLLAESILSDQDLWLWSDIHRRTRPDGQEVTGLADPEFKVIPLPILGSAVGAFAMASSLHIAEDPNSRPEYAGMFSRLHDAVTLRPDWVDVEQPPKTLPEKIRASITVSPVAASKYATNDGQCTYGLECNNRIDRKRTIVREVTIQHPVDVPGSILCMAPSNLGLIDETIIEDDYEPIKLLATLEEILGRLSDRGTLTDPPVMQFPDERAASGTMYAVAPNGNLVMYQFRTGDHLSQSFGWKTSGTVVGTGWQNFRDIVPGYWNVLYAVQEDSSILWYRHDGAANDIFGWTGPNAVEPVQVHVGRSIDFYVPGTFGQLYEVVRALTFGGRPDTPAFRPRIRIQLQYLQHADYKNGSGGFSDPVTLSWDWEEYQSVFGGSDNVIFGIASDGRLFWHKHILVGNELRGPIEVGSGWNIYRTVFSTGNGMIFGIYPNGRMMAYRLKNWLHGPTSAWPADWLGPVPVSGPNWNGFRRIVPCFEDLDLGIG